LAGWQAVPIIAMTANAFEEDRRACGAAGMSLSFEAGRGEHLTAVVLRWLARRVPSSPPPPSPATPALALPPSSRHPRHPGLPASNTGRRARHNVAQGLTAVLGRRDRYLGCCTSCSIPSVSSWRNWPVMWPQGSRLWLRPWPIRCAGPPPRWVRKGSPMRLCAWSGI
jgi:hypothetical protein